MRQRQRNAERDAAQRELSRTMAIVQLTDDLNRTMERARSAEDFNRDVAEIVGRAAIIAGEPTHQMFDMLRISEARERGIRVVPKERDLLSLGAGPLSSYAMEKIRYEVLHLLDYETVVDMMRRCMHIKVRLADSEVRYTISDTALNTMDRGKIAHQLVRALLDDLFVKRGRRG